MYILFSKSYFMIKNSQSVALRCLCHSLTNWPQMWFSCIVVHQLECIIPGNGTYGELITAFYSKLRHLLMRIPCLILFFLYWNRMWQLLHHFAARAGKAASCPASTGAAAAPHHKHSWICLVAETPGGKDLWRPGEVQLMLLTRKRQSLHAQRFSLSCRALLETIDRQ